MHNIRKLRRNLDYTSILTIRLEMVRKSETEQMLFSYYYGVLLALFTACSGLESIL